MWRDIHSAVEPDWVSEAIALTLRWKAVNSAAIAIDWSIRVNARVSTSRSNSMTADFSASAQICAIASTVSTGYLPVAVSADSITASVPSSTALATSETSARVGTGFWIIDSIICVAVIVSLFASRAIRIIRFCSPGTVALPTSTARSPRATMMPSEASMISASAWNRLRPLDLRDHQRMAAGGAQELARLAHVVAGLGERNGEVIRADRRGSAQVVLVLGRERRCRQSAPLPVDALVVRQLPAHDDASDDLPAVDCLDGELDQAVVEQQHGARRDVADELLVVEADAMSPSPSLHSASSTNR